MTADLSTRIALTLPGATRAAAPHPADLKTFAAFGVYGASAITAVTVQSTSGVEAVEPLPADLVTAQIEAVAGDLRIDVTKIGMLATAAIVEAVAAAIKELELPLVVLDPVLVSSSGARLLDADGVQAMCLELLPLARAITPNIAEAEALSGRRIGSPAEARDAARRIHDMGAATVIITGGHGPGTKDGPRTQDQGPGTEVIDLVLHDGEFHEFRAPRIESTSTHGTGCTYASALAAAWRWAARCPTLRPALSNTSRRNHPRSGHRPRPRSLTHFGRFLNDFALQTSDLRLQTSEFPVPYTETVTSFWPSAAIRSTWRGCRALGGARGRTPRRARGGRRGRDLPRPRANHNSGDASDTWSTRPTSRWR